jgi:hypothetical protein
MAQSGARPRASTQDIAAVEAALEEFATAGGDRLNTPLLDLRTHRRLLYDGASMRGAAFSATLRPPCSLLKF